MENIKVIATVTYVKVSRNASGDYDVLLRWSDRKEDKLKTFTERRDAVEFAEEKADDYDVPALGDAKDS